MVRRTPLSFLICQLLGTVASLVCLVGGVWLLLYCFVLPRDRGYAGAGNPPDMEGLFSLIGGVLAIAWSLPLMGVAVALWAGKRGAANALAFLCSIQLLPALLFLFTNPHALAKDLKFLAFTAMSAACVAAGLTSSFQRRAESKFRPGFPIDPAPPGTKRSEVGFEDIL